MKRLVSLLFFCGYSFSFGLGATAAVSSDVLVVLFRPARVKGDGDLEFYDRTECPLIHSFYNMTIKLTVEQQVSAKCGIHGTQEYLSAPFPPLGTATFVDRRHPEVGSHQLGP